MLSKETCDKLKEFYWVGVITSTNQRDVTKWRFSPNTMPPCHEGLTWERPTYHDVVMRKRYLENTYTRPTIEHNRVTCGEYGKDSGLYKIEPSLIKGDYSYSKIRTGSCGNFGKYNALTKPRFID